MTSDPVATVGINFIISMFVFLVRLLLQGTKRFYNGLNRTQHFSLRSQRLLYNSSCFVSEAKQNKICIIFKSSIYKFKVSLNFLKLFWCFFFLLFFYSNFLYLSSISIFSYFKQHNLLIINKEYHYQIGIILITFMWKLIQIVYMLKK